MEFPLFVPFADFQEASSWEEMSSKECWPFLIQAIPGFPFISYGEPVKRWVEVYKRHGNPSCWNVLWRWDSSSYCIYIYTYTLGSKQPMISISFIFIHHPQRISQVSKYSTFTPPSHTQMKPNGILSATPGESSNSSYLGWRKFQLCFTPFFLGKTCFFWSHKKGGVELRNAELLCQWQLRETLLHPVPDV